MDQKTSNSDTPQNLSEVEMMNILKKESAELEKLKNQLSTIFEDCMKKTQKSDSSRSSHQGSSSHVSEENDDDNSENDNENDDENNDNHDNDNDQHSGDILIPVESEFFALLLQNHINMEIDPEFISYILSMNRTIPLMMLLNLNPKNLPTCDYDQLVELLKELNTTP